MAKLRFGQFSGEIPKLIPRLLPDTAAQHAENVRLDDGGLTPVRKLKETHVFEGLSGLKTIYKFGDDWLAWDTVVNAVPGPVATDRLYYTGDGAPKMRVGSTVYDLAVPYPSSALTASVTGSGTGDVITRLYVYTWVTDFGEESEPCPVSNAVNWQSGQTVTLTGFASTPSGRNITKQRIYRSQSSSQAGTDLFLLEERAASTSSFTDTYSPTQFGEILPSRDWNQPPDDLSGLIAMPNGMMAGFSGKQLCFCEPFRPHAWPEKYRLSTAYPIVALAAYGTTVVAATEGFPYVATGNSPDSMVEEKSETVLPCINARGMVDLGYSAAYPSNDGLVVISAGGAGVATEALFTRKDWQKLSPSTLVAGQFAGRYFASYSYAEIDGTLFEGTVILDLAGRQPFVIRAPWRAESFFYDIPSSQLFVLIGNTVYEYDALGMENEIMTWRCKPFVLPAPATFGAIRIDGVTSVTDEEEAARQAAIAAINTSNAALFAKDSMGSEIDGAAVDTFALGGDGLQQPPPAKYAIVTIYADGVPIRVSAELNKAVRIRGDRKARVWEIQVNGTAEIEAIKMATTMRELNEIP